MLKTEEHDKIINQIAELMKVDGIDQAKLSLSLQSLRDNYNNIKSEVSENTKKLETTSKMNEDLRSANMMLLSKLSVDNDFLGKKPNNVDKSKDENEVAEGVKSLDEIALELLK